MGVRSLYALVIFLLVSMPAPARCEHRIVVFELQDLVWECVDPSRGIHEGSAAVGIAPELLPSPIDRIYIQLYGTAVPGTLGCSEPEDWALRIDVSLHDAVGDNNWTGHGNVAQNGSFGPLGNIIRMECGTSESLEFLRAGNSQVLLTGSGASRICPTIYHVSDRDGGFGIYLD